jgi:hypothetical protein
MIPIVLFHSSLIIISEFIIEETDHPLILPNFVSVACGTNIREGQIVS